LVLTGCTSKIYNTPYIDADETIQLEYQLTKDEIINLLGKPLYVESGNKINDEVFWIYEVRARSVKSETSLSLGKLSVIPNKDHNDTQPTSPLHHLRITFIDGKVSSWQALDQDKIVEEETVDKSGNEKEKKVEKSIVEKLKPKSKKKEKTPKKTFFHPKVDIFINDGNYRESVASIGVYFGFEKPQYRFGIDALFGVQNGIMIVFEKRNLYKGINLIAGVGQYVHEFYNNYCLNELVRTTKVCYSKHSEGKSSIKMGINKTFVLIGKPVTPGIELAIDPEGRYDRSYPSFSIAYHLK